MAKYVDDSHRPHLLLNGKVNGRLASKQNAVELIKPRPILFILNMIRIFVVVVIFIQSLFSLQYNGDSGNEANLKQHFGTGHRSNDRGFPAKVRHRCRNKEVQPIFV